MATCISAIRWCRVYKVLLRMYVLTNVKIKVIWAMAIGKSFFLHSTQVSVCARARLNTGDLNDVCLGKQKMSEH